ncbi:MAG: hypothetical protein Rhims3KO_09360 [Hyphomicrobiales bacterium]
MLARQYGLGRVCRARELIVKRDKEVREKAHILLEELLELYIVNNPQFGVRTELDKTDNAYRVIETFWQLFDLLGYWAQCHLAALSRGAFDAEFVEAISQDVPNLSRDSHILEDEGTRFLKAIDSQFSREEFLFFKEDKTYLTDGGLGDQMVRDLMADLLSSRSQAGNSWRFPLARALRALNEGQYDSLFKPWPRRRVGQAFDLAQWRLEAILQIQFRVGQGWKKYRAQEVVADGIGQSIETLRSWEKELKFDPEYGSEMAVAEIAGRHEAQLDAGHILGFPDYGTYRGLPLIEKARDLLPILRERQMDVIAQKIRELRHKPKVGA